MDEQKKPPPPEPRKCPHCRATQPPRSAYERHRCPLCGARVLAS